MTCPHLDIYIPLALLYRELYMISYTNTFTPMYLWGPSRVCSIYYGLAYPFIICFRRDRYMLAVCWTEHCVASISWGDPVPDAWHGY